jgi:hypothetical protein
MNSSVTSPLSGLSKAMRTLITTARLCLGRLFSFAVARVLVIFLLGFAAGVAWESYGGAGRKTIAGWSPYLAWLAPPAAAPASTSPDRFKAMLADLASTRQSLDKLAKEISQAQAQDSDAARRNTDAPRRKAAR